MATIFERHYCFLKELLPLLVLCAFVVTPLGVIAYFVRKRREREEKRRRACEEVKREVREMEGVQMPVFLGPGRR
jgi:type III secretory pathway component EscU